MKKSILAVILTALLTLTACSSYNESIETDKSSNPSVTMLDEGIWPENEYTDGLPIPSGSVDSVVFDTASGYCGIFLIDLTDDEYNDYMETLKKDGFFTVEEVSEEIEDQDYVSIGTVLSNNEKYLSISYMPGHLGIYISFN